MFQPSHLVAIPFAVLSLACASSSSPPPPPSVSKRVEAPPPLTITLTHQQSDREKATRAQVERLVSTYDLKPWLFTTTLAIDEEAIPHSHPVLTLHTKHLNEDDQLLSTIIHEELHWWLLRQHEATDAAIVELEARFPSLPVGYPEGAETKRSNYVHLPLIHLEYEGLKRLVGEARAQAAFTYWEHDHYRALYRLYRENQSEIAALTKSHGLDSFPRN